MRAFRKSHLKPIPFHVCMLGILLHQTVSVKCSDHMAPESFGRLAVVLVQQWGAVEVFCSIRFAEAP